MLFETPSRIGILQYVVYDPRGREGVLIAEGCKKGVCVKYYVYVEKDGGGWRVRRFKRPREEGGGCIKQQTADALWELAERGHEVGLWREGGQCGVVVDGVKLFEPICKTAEECAKQLLWHKSVSRVAEVLGEKATGLTHKQLSKLMKILENPQFAEALRGADIWLLLEAEDGSEICVLDGRGAGLCFSERMRRAEFEPAGAEYRPRGLYAYAAGTAKKYVPVF